MPNLPIIYLKMAKNQILPDCNAGDSGTALWLYLKNMTFQQATELALDKESLSKIEFHFGSLMNEYEGYTEVKAIFDRGNVIEVMLTGGRIVKEDAKDEGYVTRNGSNVVSDGEGTPTGDLHPEREAE